MVARPHPARQHFLRHDLRGFVRNGPGNPVSSVDLPAGFPADFDEGVIEPKEEFWPQLSGRVVVAQGRTCGAVTARSGWKCRELLQDFIGNEFEPVLDGKGQRTTFYLSRTGAIFYRKTRLDEQSHVLTVLRGMGTVQAASAKLAKLGIAFSYPKPTGLIEYLLRAGSAEGDIVMDFFAGSGATGEAALNVGERFGVRKFILVQLPEPTTDGALSTIADITKERVRRVIHGLDAEGSARGPELFVDEDASQRDRGFRVFKLAESNFVPWEADAPKDAKDLAKQLELHVEHIRQGRSTDDLVHELLLKLGYPLTTPVTKDTLAGKTVYSAADGLFLLCLEPDLTIDVIRAMADKKPARIVCLDMGFAGNDQLKANAVQIFKTKGVEKFLTV